MGNTLPPYRHRKRNELKLSKVNGGMSVAGVSQLISYRKYGYHFLLLLLPPGVLAEVATIS